MVPRGSISKTHQTTEITSLLVNFRPTIPAPIPTFFGSRSRQDFEVSPPTLLRGTSREAGSIPPDGLLLPAEHEDDKPARLLFRSTLRHVVRHAGDKPFDENGYLLLLFDELGADLGDRSPRPLDDSASCDRSTSPSLSVSTLHARGLERALSPRNRTTKLRR